MALSSQNLRKKKKTGNAVSVLLDSLKEQIVLFIDSESVKVSRRCVAVVLVRVSSTSVMFAFNVWRMCRWQCRREWIRRWWWVACIETSWARATARRRERASSWTRRARPARGCAAAAASRHPHRCNVTRISLQYYIYLIAHDFQTIYIMYRDSIITK